MTVYKIYKSYFNRSDITETKRGNYENRAMLQKKREKYNAQDAAINAVEKKYEEITGSNKLQNKDHAQREVNLPQCRLSPAPVRREFWEGNAQCTRKCDRLPALAWLRGDSGRPKCTRKCTYPRPVHSSVDRLDFCY